MFQLQPICKNIEILGFNSIYYFEFGKNFSHSPEAHEFWEMVYVDNGEIIAITDGVGIPLIQGQVIFHKPGEIHAHVSDNVNANNMLVISFTANSDAMSYFANKTFTLDKTTKTLLSLFLDEAQTALSPLPNSFSNRSDLDFSGAPFGSTQLLQCYFTEFLIKLFREGLGNKIKYSEESRLIAGNSMTQLIKDYLCENIYEDITLTSLCEHFRLGKSQLTKIFKDSSDSTPMDYLHNARIKEAKKLLRTSAYSVSEIADMFKYSNVHNFSRAFKKATGFSPMAYIKSIR